MSISNDSTNDCFTPAAAAADQQQVIGDAFSLDDCGHKEENAEQVGDEQLRKEAKSKQNDDDDGILKSEKLEIELKVAKQMCAFTKMELEEKSLQAELKQKRLIEENIELKIKIDRMEKEKEKEQLEKNANANQCKELLERIAELEKQQKQQKEENEKKVFVFQNAQKTLSEKIKAMEKQMKKEQQNMLFLNIRQNCWDVKFCHNELEITGTDCLTVVNKQKQSKGWRTVFAEHPIPSEDHSSGIFYFEIGVEYLDGGVLIGFAAKQKPFLSVVSRAGTYAYRNNCYVYIDGSIDNSSIYGSSKNFSSEDIVGCGVNLATRQIIFTKNGRRLDVSNSLVSSFAVPLFPFISLYGFGDKIVANFGPKFLIPAN
ncbi:hypothetical protein niasHT_039087 [Heterodera trifolii]|uniref:B30.2/SPRY domain-containing protein n=1 Tax=Heterodera trifolii TaxID=157864 RepID=A0ABD2IBL3_9BILA